jgi:NAD+ diphosphatase
MIQDIEPAVFKNEYIPKPPKHNDYVFIFKGRSILVKSENGEVDCPRVKDVGKDQLIYLFCINEKNDYLYIGKNKPDIPGYKFENISVLRKCSPQIICFAAMTAFHLSTWYENNRCCGRCGCNTILHTSERAMQCPECRNIIYPRIAPAVIVGVTNGDSIMMTRYRGREYKGHALIAGFCEIGETAEQTVEREVMEEVGLRVTNIKYFGSQPWGFDSNLLLGFFCNVADEKTVRMDESELEEARWISRNEIGEENADLSLTATMIMYFKEHPEMFD